MTKDDFGAGGPWPVAGFLAGFAAAALLLGGFQAACAAAEPATGAVRPNFVLILGEGQGWTSTSVAMDDRMADAKSELCRTPNLERLARQGMRFAIAYAALPRCTPSRAALFTGKNPALLHMTFVGEGANNRESGFSETGSKMIPPRGLLELPAGEITIGDLLLHAGYATAALGKWHVGRVSPTQHGFQENDGATSNRGPGGNDHPNPQEAYGMTERGLDFMARQVKAGRPFYLQLSHYPGRSGADARKATYEAVLKRAGGREDQAVDAAAVTEDMDVTIGMVLKKIDELGIAGKTYVLYTADHGSPGRVGNRPLTGGKGCLQEGGIRVPFVVRGPGVEAGACCHARVILTDLFPTFAELSGVIGPLPKDVEGGSLVPLFSGRGVGEVKRPRAELVFHYPHYDHDNEGPASAIMLRNYKLIKVYETGGLHLYDLAKDPLEQRDLAQQMPEKAAELNHLLEADLRAMNVEMATPNPNYDPSKAPEPRRKGKGGKGGRGGRRGGQGVVGGQDQLGAAGEKQRRETSGNTFCTDVPAHPCDIVLGRPSPSSITASVLFYDNAEGCLFWGTKSGVYSARTPPRQFKKGEPAELVFDKLRSDTAYFYQLRYRAGPASPVVSAAESTFHTPRVRGRPFVFTIQADSHLDEHTSPAVYRRTLENAIADGPDFHIDLGDTFMSEKHPGRETAAKHYLAQRFYFGLISRSAPLFLTLGNHDGEGARWHDGTADSLAVWSNGMRKRYFPNPFPDRFYGGNERREEFTGLLQDYYAWEWGDALFVVLDPFWYTPRPRGGGSDNWYRTLGSTQYQWLKQTLEHSRAALKFVFIHHLVGGGTKEARGGVEAAPFYEWGGRNPDGSAGFAEHRPGWPLPIHQLLLRNRVSAVFHGHDHLYVKQDLDGIVYQEVPQPGAAEFDRTSTAVEYGYKSGVLLGSPGHLRVRVSPERATVDYVRACLPEDEGSGLRNATVAHSYTLSAKPDLAR